VYLRSQHQREHAGAGCNPASTFYRPARGAGSSVWLKNYRHPAPRCEALNRLAQEDLVVLTPYRGYAVSPITVEDIQELCELRMILESEAAAKAAERAAPEDIATLESKAELRYVPGDRSTYDQYIKSNSAFHQALARCTRNMRVESAIMAVLDQLQRPLFLGLDVGLDAGAATAEHHELVRAVRTGDSRLAREIQVRQISGASDRMVAAVVRAQSALAQPA
jgi:DNA-binding GntR family transcriptional regulator